MASSAAESHGIMEDLSTNKLIAAAFGGDGFYNPRLVGGAFFALGAALGLLTVILLVATGYYFYYVVAAAPVFGWGGIWLIITGEPKHRPQNQPVPTWGRLGLLGALAFGLLQAIGILVTFSM